MSLPESAEQKSMSLRAGIWARGPSPATTLAPGASQMGGGMTQASVTAHATLEIWRARLDPPTLVLSRLAATLSPEERARAMTYRDPVAQRRYAATRGILRQVLGGRLARDPAGLRFAYGPHGKPVLADGAISFNLSHSAELALIAIAPAGAVGVDVEHRRRLLGTDRLAARFCTPAERAALARLPEPQRGQALLQLWTCKEAVLKALGERIGRALAEIEVTMDQSGRATLKRVSLAAAPHPARWQLRSWHPLRDYVAAVATAGPTLLPLRSRVWSAPPW